MINTINTQQQIAPQLYKTEEQIIKQYFAFWGSKIPLMIGGSFIIFTGAKILFSYLESGKIPLTITGENILNIGIAALGIWIFTKGKIAWEERKMKGGVLPADTFIILDGSKRIAIKQKDFQEKSLGSFEEISLNIEKAFHKNEQIFTIILKHPAGKEIFAKINNEQRAKDLLQNIKNHLLL